MAWWLVLLVGCAAMPTRRSVARAVPESGAVLQRQQTKDSAVLQASERIDMVASSSDLAEPIREHTDTIRAAVAEAPAAEVAVLTTQYNRVLEKQAADISRLEDKLAREQTRARVSYQRWLRMAAAGLFFAFGISVVFGGRAVTGRMWPIAALGVGALVLAEVIGSVWFQVGSLIVTAVGAAYAVYWVIDRHKRGRLQQALNKRVDAVRQIVPVLDEAYDNANEELRRFLDRSIFERLSDRLSGEEKAEIHTIRKEARDG